MFECVECHKEFKTSQSYKNHLARKTPCVKPIIQCDRCLQVFKRKEHLTKHLNRKFPCEKVDLMKENIELKHQLELKDKELEIANLKKTPKIFNTINNNNTIINNFGDEVVGKIKYKLLKDGINKILQSSEVNTPGNYLVEDFAYTNEDIKDIDIFRLFVKLIFNNKDIPENNTIQYDEIFYYRVGDDWVPLDPSSNNILIDMVYKKIQLLITDKRINVESNIRELSFYIGDNYNVNIVELDYYNNIKNIKMPTSDKYKYTKILQLEYKNKFNLQHKLNQIQDD
jgi:uncharacterized C2H2 Zn-finger protein